MSPELTVGVAVPVYNSERFLGDTLRSVLAQPVPIRDVVVVDDGSDDASAEIAREIGSPVRVVCRPHAGIGATRSHAMSVVAGDCLLPLDADDLLPERAVAPRLEILSRQPEVDVVFGHICNVTMSADGRPVELDQPRPAHVPNGMLIRRSAYERVGPFATHLRVAETLDWMLRARELGLNERTVSDLVLWRRVHGANNSLTQRSSLHEFPRALKASLDRRRTSRS